YRTYTHARTVQVELEEGDLTGRGEAFGVPYRDETVESMLDQVAAVSHVLCRDPSRAALLELLPAGGARDALECALSDLEAKRAACRVWQLAGVASVRPLTTAFTLGLDDPDAVA